MPRSTVNWCTGLSGGSGDDAGSSAMPCRDSNRGATYARACQRDADDTEQHDRGPDQARAEAPLAQPQAADHRGEHDRQLARGDDVARLREPEREEHQRVGERAHGGGQHDGGPAPELAPHGGAPEAQQRQAEDRASALEQEHVRHRIEPAHPRLVDQRVGRDRQPGHDRPQQDGPGDAAAGRAPRRHHVQRHDPRDHEHDAERAERREPLLEHQQRDDRHQRHAQAARDGIDERVGAGGVRAPERVEIQRVQEDRRDHERHRRRRQSARDQMPEAERQQDRRRGQRGEPQEDDLVAAALGHGVPAGVQTGGAQDEREGGETHPRIRTSARRGTPRRPSPRPACPWA
jgi:hypothetical protein